MNTKGEVVKYTWKIDYPIWLKYWGNSEKFYLSGKDKVGFDVGLRGDINWNSLHLRVRKYDLRPAKAIVQIKQIHASQPNVALPTQELDSGNSLTASSTCSPHLNSTPTTTLVNSLEINYWKEFYTFNITGYKNESFTQLAIGSFNNYVVKMTIEVEITWLGFITEQPEKITPINFQSFLNADLFKDITLIVDDKELPAHKIILSAHSSYFNAMLTTETKEAKENRITIENFSIDVITEMLEFFYTNRTKASNDVNVALKMIKVAKTYGIINLKEICESTLLRNLHITNVLTILKVADDLNATRLHQQAIKFISDNKNRIYILDSFECKNLCQSKPLLMYELMCAIGKIESPKPSHDSEKQLKFFPL